MTNAADQSPDFLRLAEQFAALVEIGDPPFVELCQLLQPALLALQSLPLGTVLSPLQPKPEVRVAGNDDCGSYLGDLRFEPSVLVIPPSLERLAVKAGVDP
jgi:hypothetical protein